MTKLFSRLSCLIFGLVVMFGFSNVYSASDNNGYYVRLTNVPLYSASNTSDVYIQLYNNLNVKVGPEQIVNEYIDAEQTQAVYDVNNNGLLVVAWMEKTTVDYSPIWGKATQDGSYSSIYYQLYDISSGSLVKIGSNRRANEFAGNLYTYNSTNSSGRSLSSVSVNDSGNFVISWESIGEYSTLKTPVVRLFNSFGNPLTGDIIVDSTTNSPLELITNVAIRDNGNFSVVWAKYITNTAITGARRDIYLQNFDSSGNKLGSAFRIDTTQNFDQRKPKIKYISGVDKYFVSWTSLQLETVSPTVSTHFLQVFGKIYNSDFTVNTNTFRIDQTGNHSFFHEIDDVYLSDSNKIVVAWTNSVYLPPTTPSPSDVGRYFSVYNANGTLINSFVNIPNNQSINLKSNPDQIVFTDNLTRNVVNTFSITSPAPSITALYQSAPNTSDIQLEAISYADIGEIILTDDTGNLVIEEIDGSSVKSNTRSNIITLSLNNPCLVSQMKDEGKKVNVKIVNIDGVESLPFEVGQFEYDCFNLNQAGQGKTPYQKAIWLKYYSSGKILSEIKIYGSQNNLLDTIDLSSISYSSNKIDREQKLLTFGLNNVCAVSNEFKTTKRVYIEILNDDSTLSNRIPVRSFNYSCRSNILPLNR